MSPEFGLEDTDSVLIPDMQWTNIPQSYNLVAHM